MHITRRVLSALAALTVTASIVFPDVALNTPLPVASAHNLQMEIQFVSIDPSFKDTFDQRITARQPLIQAGDVITLVFGGLPNIGTVDGLGGYFDFYPVTGTQVLDAQYVRPVPGGYAAAPIKKSPGPGTVIGTSDPTGLLKALTLGPNINGVTAKPSSAGNVNQGTLYGFYGDTGIFYSTDPRTVRGSWGNESGNIVNNRGEVVNDVPVTRFDIEQLRALGMSAPVGCMFDSACRGSGPWGMGSPVAGPESGYQWSFRITNTLTSGVQPFSAETGPFRRIRYPGSQVSYDAPGNLSGLTFDTSLDASGIGYALSPANPLPATASWNDTTSTKLVRFALGRIIFNQPEYARVVIKVNDPSALLLPTGCPLITTMAFAGDAGINSGGKDVLWRYFNPTVTYWNPCLAVFKTAEKPAYSLNEVFTFTLKAYNTGAITLTNTTVRDSLPAGLTYVGAAPAPATTSPLAWNVGVLPPNQSWSAILTVRATSAGFQPNSMALTSNEGAAATQAIVAVAAPIMSESKSVTPASAAPGATVTYTIRLSNTGTGASSTPIKIYESLPPGFSFTGLKRVTVNGADMTSSSSATAGSPVTISLPSASAVAAGQAAEIVFTAKVGTGVTAGSYCNDFVTAYGVNTSATADTACVDIASASIGDTIYRDWNGNGVQDPGEEGIPGVVLTLSNGLTTTTDADGKYLFNALPAGTYSISVASVPNHSVTGDPDGVLNGVTSVTLTPTQTYLGGDFGLRPTGSSFIGNEVFDDLNKNGTLDAGESRIANVTVRLYEDTNGNGVIDPEDVNVMTTTTSAGGFYTFTNLAPGLDYIAAVDANDSDLGTYYSPNTFAATTPTSIAVPDLAPGGVSTADFGFWEAVPGSIGDKACVDANGDGLCADGETGIFGVRIRLYTDANGDGIGDSVLMTATTSVTGWYSLDGLPAGNYVISIDPTDPAIPGGYSAVVTELTATLSAGAALTTIDFPFVPLLTKQVSRTSAVANDVIVYTITQNYPGNALLSNYILQDPLPAGTTFVGASAGGTHGAYVTVNGTPGIYDDGATTAGMALSVAPTTVANGGVVTVTMALTASTPITNVTPSISPLGRNAVCSGPTTATPITVTSSATNVRFTCTLPTIGEYTFEGAASSSFFEFDAGVSNSAFASRDGSTTLTTWNLGSTVVGVDGFSLGAGSRTTIYALQGSGKPELISYSPISYTWSLDPPADYGANINQGGAMAWNGQLDASAKIFALRGDDSTVFKYYSPSSDSWTNGAALPNKARYGAALTHLNGVVYALRGNNTLNFYTYTVATDAWATGANVSGTAGVKDGGALATDGTYVYALKGNNTKEFYRYTPATNSWTTRASTPLAITKGGALVYAGGYLYATQGGGKKVFMRYNPVSDTWSDTAVADLPASVSGGGALATDGAYVYALAGNNTKTFYKYSIATNTWTKLADASVSVKDGGALVLVPGSAQVDKGSSMAVSRSAVNSGGAFSVTLELYAGSNITTVTPGPLTISDTAGAGGSAVCGNPSPASISAIVSGTSQSISWSCTATASTRPANLVFSAVATASLPSTAAFQAASSPSVIVVPPLTMSVRVNDPMTVDQVENEALLHDDAVVPQTPSNLVRTLLSTAIGDFVWADLDGDGQQDAGEPGIPSVVVRLTAANGTVLTTTTDASGAYNFAGLTAGTYTVTYDLSTVPSGFKPSTPTSLVYTVSGSQVVTTADFGLRPPGAGSIGDTVWLDADNDGTFNGDPALNPYEYALPGVTVTLYADVNNNGVIDAGDYVMDVARTDANGQYLFSGLDAGKYLVQVDTRSTVTSPFDSSFVTTIGAAMTTTVGTTIDRAVTLSAGQQITTADFGFNWTASIGDYVWYDTSLDGVQDNGADEGGAPGAVVELYYDTDGNGEIDPGEPILKVVLATTSTGAYLFANLPPGNYIVEAEGQAIPAPASSGAQAGKYEQMLPTTEDELPIALGAGQAVRDADFGFAAGAKVEGNIFYDPNLNGIKDPNETTVFPGIVVTLTSSTGTVYTTTTGPDGSYHFGPVPPGSYTVTYDPGNPALADYPQLTNNPSRSIDLAPGETERIDFGRAYDGSIGDTVWMDADGDGTQDPGEQGLPGVTVRLYQNGELIASLATDEFGRYSFGGLVAGSYTVTVAADTVPTALSIATTPAVASVTLAANQNYTDADFGFRAPLAHNISGSIFDDLNGDGVLTETGRLTTVNVIVVFTPTGGSPVRLTVPVDENGDYAANGIPAGSDISISVDPETVPPGYAITTDPLLTIDNIASDKVDQDFGYQRLLSSLTGVVVIGQDGDGLADNSETPVASVTVTLRYAGPDGFFGTDDDELISTATDAAGAYTFTNLLPGTYEVVKTNPQALDSLADRDGGAPDSIIVSLARGENKTQQDFELFQPTADLSVTKIDSTDPVSAGQMLSYTIVVANAGPDAANDVVVTDVLPSEVTFVSAQPSAASSTPVVWNLGRLNAGSSITAVVTVRVKADASGRITNTVTVASPATDPTPGNNSDVEPTDILKIPSGVISGHVFEDTDGDGVQDPNEPNIPGVVIVITDSLGLTSTVTTDANGDYTATVPAGPAITDVDEDTLPPGYQQTAGDDVTPVVVPDGGTVDAGDDGYQPGNEGTILLGDFVWFDANKNGVQDGYESGLSYALVKLYSAGGFLMRQARTDAFGYYRFEKLYPGDYYVTFEVAGSSYSFTSPDSSAGDDFDSDVAPLASRAVRTAVLVGRADASALTADRLSVDGGVVLPTGVAPAGLVVRVWYDVNNDGIRDGSEEPVSAVMVRIVDANTGEIVALASTDSSGIVSVNYLAPGSYYAEIVPSTSYTFTLPNVGSEDHLDSDVDAATSRTPIVTLAPGQIDDSLAAGLVLPPTIEPVDLSGFVWLDTNRNNAQDAGETGVSGALVYLLDGSGNVLSMVRTDSSGHYEFVNLEPGSYQVRIVRPDGYESAQQNVGSDASDSDVDPLSGESAVITLTSGQSAQLDAGLQLPVGVTPASISGCSWIDADQDGIQDAGETYVAGLVVRIYDENGALVAVTTTDANGCYVFTNLPPGGYYVTIQEPTDTQPTNQNSGADTNVDSNVDNFGRTPLIVVNPGDVIEHIDGGWVPEAPLAVTLDSFRVVQTPQGMRITWRTLLEVDTLGFRILRSATAVAADAEPVNQELILATGGGTEYSIVDAFGSPRSTYWLEETETDGDVIIYGPFTTRPVASSAHKAYFPIVVQ